MSQFQGRAISTSSQADALENGGMRIGTTGQISISDNLNIILENPAGSGVELTLFALVTFTDAGSETFPTLHENPTTDLPTTERTIRDTNLGTTSTSAASLRADDMTTEMSGADATFVFGIESGRNEHRIFYKLPPGTSVGLSNPFSGLTSATATFSAWFIEQPA